MTERLLPILLHGHCPPCSHLSGDARAPFLRQRFELVVDCLLPLVELLDRWASEHTQASLTLALSPSLVSDLTGESSQAELDTALRAASEMAEREQERLATTPVFGPAANWHVQRLARLASLFRERCRRNPLTALVEHARQGRLDLISSPAAQDLLPAGLSPEMVSLHIRAARRVFAPWLEEAPRGMWLPGCDGPGGVAHALAGLDYVLVAAPAPPTNAGPVVQRPEGPTVVAVDHRMSARLVQLARDDRFLDLGDPSTSPISTAAAWRLDRLARWQRPAEPPAPPMPYDPPAAHEHAASLAHAWLGEIGQAAQPDGSVSLPVLALDLRLLGAWWIEGPRFLAAAAGGAGEAGLRLCSVAQAASKGIPGADGALPSRRWIGPLTAPLFRQIEMAQRRTLPLLARAERLRPWGRRALAQALRELLFAQSSDWPVLVAGGVAVDSALVQLAGHLHACHELLERVERDDVDRDVLRNQETRYPIWTRPEALLNQAEA